MKKNITKILLIIFLLVVMILSCSKKNKEMANVKEYNKIVVLDPAVVEMIYLLESENRIVGVANLERSQIWPEEKVKKLPSVGTFMKPSLEKIIALKPDLVVASFHTTEELDRALKENNIEVKRYGANSIEEIFNNFQEVGKLLGKEEMAKKINEEKKIKLEQIKNTVKEEKKGLFILSASPLMAFGKDTLPNDILKILKIKNVAESLEGTSPIVTPEYLIKENPEVMMTMVKDPSEIGRANPQLKNVNAIKNNDFILVNSSQILRGSPRTIDHIIDVYEKIKK